MNKKLLLIICSVVILGIIVVLFIIFNPAKPKNSESLLTGLNNLAKKATPSETLKVYTDPSGFTFSYPDNLSILAKDATDSATYADIQLNSKDVSGSLNLKITDSKYKTLGDWVKLNKDAAVSTKEVQLGSLKAMEITTNDRILLGALDKGVFFDIEMPKIEQDFWSKVYNKVITGFAFVTPDSSTTQSSSSDVIFEGEEVVE